MYFFRIPKLQELGFNLVASHTLKFNAVAVRLQSAEQNTPRDDGEKLVHLSSLLPHSAGRSLLPSTCATFSLFFRFCLISRT